MASLTVGATATQLSSSTTEVWSGINITAAAGNTGYIYIGYDNTVTAGTAAASTDGVTELAAGASYFIPKKKAASPSIVYLIASAAAQKVLFDIV